MKRTLSILLAAVMLIGLMPSIAFAADVPEEFVVDFTQVDTTTLDSTNHQYAVRGGVAAGPNWSLVTSETSGSTVFNKGSRVRFYTKSYLQFGLYTDDVNKKYDTLVIKFTVPTDGMYDISGLFVKNTAGGYGDICIDGVKQITYDFYASATENKTVKITEKPIELVEGTHTITLTGRNSQSDTYAYVSVYNFTFTPVPASDYFAVDFRTGDISTMTPTEGWGTDSAVPGATRYPNYLATTKGSGWSVDAANSTIADGNTGSYFAKYSSFATWNPSNSYITFDFEIEGDGAAYDITAYGMHRPEGGYINYFIDGVFAGKFDCQAAAPDYDNSTATKLRPLTLSGGAHKLTLLSEKGAINGVMLPAKVTFEKTEALTAISSVSIESDKTELKKNETAKLSGVLAFENEAKIDLRASKFNTGNSPLDGSSDGTLKITYKSSDNQVATVSESGVITAFGGGNADITATVEIEGTSVTSNSVSVTVKDDSAPSAITFAADSIGDIFLEIGGVARSYNKLSAVQIERGENVKITASDVAGKKFVGWVRGSADYGRIVSVDAEYEFTAATHTMLTAIYADIPEDSAAVEYYNENGQYIETRAVADGKPKTNPTLVGYVFSDWWTAKDMPLVFENVTALTRAVAKFTKEETKYTVTVPTTGVSGAQSGEYYYDDEITLTSTNGNVYWLRDDKVVDYGATYTFNVWGKTTITIAESGYDNAPKVIMDDVVKSDAYMIEYDAGDKSIVEVGIIFGSNDAITISSCEEKMNSQRNSSHGQFTAQSDYQNAKGYLIYKDGGEYKVVYSE